MKFKWSNSDLVDIRFDIFTPEELNFNMNDMNYVNQPHINETYQDQDVITSVNQLNLHKNTESNDR